MKNIVLGIIGILITFYTLLIGLNVLYFQTQKNQLEKQVSRVVKNMLETEYQKGDESFVKQMLLQEIKNVISEENGNLEIEVQGIDLQKGLLSVRVIKRVELLNGKEKTIVVDKTAIMDRRYVSYSKYFVGKYLVGARGCTSWGI